MSKLERLRLAISEVLFYIWNPIGVPFIPEVRDEYESYVRSIFNLVVRKAGPDQVASELDAIAKEHMGIELNKGESKRAADTIYAWVRVIDLEL